MRLSVVIPVFSVEKDIISFVEAVEKKVREHTKDYNIIVSTNQEFEYVEKWHERLPKSVDLVAVKLTDDYQQVVMAGVDKADGDATIIITNEYDISLIDTMIEDWKNGRKVVCLRRKHTKFGKIITKIRLKIYNLFLFLFGDIFSIGILKDCQLLDKEIVDKMKGEQDMAHRLRTMYAPLDYNTSVHDISHPIEKFETKGTPQFDFWVGAVGSVIILLAFITCIILGIALSAPIWLWTLFIIFWFIFEFLFLALLVNATAKVKIGILHNVDEFGKIYNLVQEYHATAITKRQKVVLATADNTTNAVVNDDNIANKNVVETKSKSTKIKKTNVDKKIVAKKSTTNENKKDNGKQKNKKTKADATIKKNNIENVDNVENNEKISGNLSDENLNNNIVENANSKATKSVKASQNTKTTKSAKNSKSGKAKTQSNLESGNGESVVTSENEQIADKLNVKKKASKKSTKTE